MCAAAEGPCGCSGPVHTLARPRKLTRPAISVMFYGEGHASKSFWDAKTSRRVMWSWINGAFPCTNQASTSTFQHNLSTQHNIPSRRVSGHQPQASILQHNTTMQRCPSLHPKPYGRTAATILEGSRPAMPLRPPRPCGNVAWAHFCAFEDPGHGDPKHVKIILRPW